MYCQNPCDIVADPPNPLRRHSERDDDPEIVPRIFYASRLTLCDNDCRTASYSFRMPFDLCPRDAWICNAGGTATRFRVTSTPSAGCMKL